MVLFKFSTFLLNESLDAIYLWKIFFKINAIFSYLSNNIFKFLFKLSSLLFLLVSISSNSIIWACKAAACFCSSSELFISFGKPKSSPKNFKSILNRVLNLKLFDKFVLFILFLSYNGTGGSWSKLKIIPETSLFSSSSSFCSPLLLL